jgi:hypothetical protein
MERRGTTSSMDSIRGLRQELAAAVAKIFELREIIRNLEQQLDSRDRAAKVRNVYSSARNKTC